MTEEPPDEGPSGWPSRQTIRRVAVVWILVAAAAVTFALKFGPHGAHAVDVPPTPTQEATTPERAVTVPSTPSSTHSAAAGSAGGASRGADVTRAPAASSSRSGAANVP